MLNTDKKPELQSRRYVQRRFPPGTLFVYGKGSNLGTIIGWAPIAANVNPANGYIRSAASWEVLVLYGDSRVERLNWSRIREWLTVEEWENLE